LEDKPLAAGGGEGVVHRVQISGTYSGSCVKIYHPQKRTDTRRKKVEFMIRNKPQSIISKNFIICWPTEMIFDSNHDFIGFLMPLAFFGSENLYELTRPHTHKRLQSNWSKFDRTTVTGIEKRLKVCVNIAIAIHSIHQSGRFAIVDYKPQNILITTDGKISITDVDSFQISNNGAVLFYAEVATPEYAPSESIKINPSKALVPESWDRFSLAVSFYEIIFGIHPFVATCDGQYQEVTTLDKKIQKGLFVHGSKKSYLTVIPSLHNNFQNLPLSLQKLFIKAFEDGHTNSEARPTAEEWGMAIHGELSKMTNIVANTITTAVNPKKIQTNNLNNQSAATLTNTQPVNSANSQKNIKTIANKGDYMIWKILTVILLILCAILFFFSNSYNKEVSRMKYELVEAKDANSSLKSSESIASRKYAELESTLNGIAEKYPITFLSASFVNSVNGQRSNQAQSFNANEIGYIHPVVMCNANSINSTENTIYYCVYNPNNILIYTDNYTYTNTGKVITSAAYEKNIITELNGFGRADNSCFTLIGRYNVQFWCNGIMIGTSYFDVN